MVKPLEYLCHVQYISIYSSRALTKVRTSSIVITKSWTLIVKVLHGTGIQFLDDCTRIQLSYLTVRYHTVFIPASLAHLQPSCYLIPLETSNDTPSIAAPVACVVISCRAPPPSSCLMSSFLSRRTDRHVVNVFFDESSASRISPLLGVASIILDEVLFRRQP